MVTFLRIGEPKRFVSSRILLMIKDLSVHHVHQFHQVDIHLQAQYLSKSISLHEPEAVKFDAHHHVGLPNQPKASRHPFPKTMMLSLNFFTVFGFCGSYLGNLFHVRYKERKLSEIATV